MDSQLTCSLRASSFAVLRWQLRELAGGHANKHVRRRTETFLLLAQLQCRHDLERIAPINQLLDTAILNCNRMLVRKRIFHLARISLTPILVSYQNLRLVFTTDGAGAGAGAGVGVEVLVGLKRAYDLVKIEYRSRKRSHKLDRIGVGRIRTFSFLPIPFTTPSLMIQ